VEILKNTTKIITGSTKRKSFCLQKKNNNAIAFLKTAGERSSVGRCILAANQTHSF